MAKRKKRLTIEEVGERLEIKPSTWRSYVSRGQAPPADGMDWPRPGTAAAVPWWYESTIDEYVDGRVGPGRVDTRYKEVSDGST